MEEKKQYVITVLPGKGEQFPGNPPGQLPEEELEKHRLSKDFFDEMRVLFKDELPAEELLKLLTK
ncbi:MAG: hypothetical protein H7Z72_19300 [Bacteroidetes bacterium]|nr:hypothetical protein [Fibrella sp.]